MNISKQLLLHIGLIASVTSYTHGPDVTTETISTSISPAQQEISIVSGPVDSSDSSACPSTTQQLTLKFKPMMASLAGLTGFSYLHGRSILFAHEAAHLVVSELGGYKTTGFYVSPQFFGGGHVYTSVPRGTISDVLVTIAGPLGGVAAYIAWLKIWNILMHYWKTGQTKESVIQGIKDPIFNEDSSLWAIGGTFWGASLHWLGNMVPSGINPVNMIPPAIFKMFPGAKPITHNDADDIRSALTYLAPLLAKAYPFLAYAGLAGLLGYGAYGIYATCKIKKAAGKPLW